MRLDVYLTVVKSRAKQAELARYAALRLDSGRMFALSGALCAPRLWAQATGQTLQGFGSGLRGGRGSHAAERLDVAVQHARSSLLRLGERLIERRVPDANLLALLFEHGDLHVTGVGDSRAYLYRRGDIKRLTPRDEKPDGLVTGQPFRSGEHLEPLDIVVAGSATAFSQQAIAQFGAVIKTDNTPTPSVLAQILADPSAKSGAGSVVMIAKVV